MLTFAEELAALVGAVQRSTVLVTAERQKKRRTCHSYAESQQDRESIVAFLKRRRKPLPAEEIAALTGFTRSTTYNHLARLYKAGRIDRHKVHNYHVFFFKRIAK